MMRTPEKTHSGIGKLTPPANTGTSMQGEVLLPYRADVAVTVRKLCLSRGGPNDVDDSLGLATFRVDTPVTDATAQALQQRLRRPVIYRGQGTIDFPEHAFRGVTDFVIDIETKPFDIAAAGHEFDADLEFRGETFQLAVTRRRMNAHRRNDGWTYFVLATKGQRDARFEAIARRYDLYRRTDRHAPDMLANLYIVLCAGLDGPLWGNL